ncbi:ABC transporter substrate-binding protein [Alkalihalobacillus sp. NPDC078783]
MNRKTNAVILTSLIGSLAIIGACSNQGEVAEEQGTTGLEETQTITHLRGESDVPLEIEKAVVLSASYIDHMLTIDEKPYAVNVEARYGGDYPAYLEDQLDGVHLVGSADEPNLEAITALDPDVILVESRTPDDTYNLLEQIAPTIVLGNEWLDYDDDPDFWTEDLLAIAGMYDKVDLAQKKIEELNQKTEDARKTIETLEDRKLAYLRLRDDMVQIYAEGGHPMNTLLYEDLNFVPSQMTPVDQREDLSLETIPEIDADYIFLEGDVNSSETVEEMKQNELWNSIPASKKNQIYATDSYWLSKGWGAIGRGQIIDEILNDIE